MSQPTGIIWSRVSSLEQSYGYSGEQQVKLCGKAASDRMINVVRTFEIHESGSRSEHRKHFREMVNYVLDQKIENIVAWKIDRLARNWRDFYSLQDMIEKGVGIFIVNDNRLYDQHSSSSDRFHFRTMGNVAQLEAETIAERTALGMTAKVQVGQITWMAPLGYLNSPDLGDPSGRRRTVIIDDKRSDLVKQSFESYATGKHTISTLTDHLNQQGLRARNGNPVSRHLVEKMLKNPFYSGAFKDKKTGALRRHTYPTFISAELFDAVQRQLKAARHKVNPSITPQRFFFKQFLRCGYCGSGITAYSPKPGQVYYDCTMSHTKQNGVKRCRQSIIYPAAEVERQLTEALGRLYVNDQIAHRVKDSLKDAHTARHRTVKHDAKYLMAEQVRLNDQIDMMYQDRLDGKINAERFTRLQDSTLARIAECEARLATARVANADYMEQGSAILDLLKGFKEAFVVAAPEGKARILSVVLKRATLTGQEWDFEWVEPFGVLFSIGELRFKNKGWGE